LMLWLFSTTPLQEIGFLRVIVAVADV